MKESEIPIIITTCIFPKSKHLVLAEPFKRLNEVLKGIDNLAMSFHKTRCPIIICDGSGYDYCDEIDFIKARFPLFEVISFENDFTSVEKYGKGFGEGEILKYAIDNSDILKCYSAFVKCTGKLWVANIEDCINSFNGKASFLKLPLLSRKGEYIDTRFYIINKEFYKECFVNAYLKVDDDAGLYLEHVYHEILTSVEGKGRGTFFKVYPRIYGVSGSSGKFHKPSLLKSKVKSLYLFLMNLGFK